MANYDCKSRRELEANLANLQAILARVTEQDQYDEISRQIEWYKEALADELV